jgi:transposase
MEVHALRKRGWSISAIARHTGHDRKTVRKYLAGEQKPGVRARPSPDPFDPFVDYVSARLVEDPHLWARTLFDELEGLGFGLSYQSLTRNIRARDLRPACAACRTATERPNAVIAHPPGDETQWDWLELPDPPELWGWGKTAHLLVGSLACSGKWRAALSRSEDQPHLVAALDRVTRGLGAVSRVWRFDRMATVCDPGSGRVSASFAGVAKHYGVSVAICPPRRGNRKGVVEKVNHTAAQRWLAHPGRRTDRRGGSSRCRPVCSRSGRYPPAGHRRWSLLGGRRRQDRTTLAAAGNAVSGDPHRSADRVAPSDGVLPRQPLLGATGTGGSRGEREPSGGWAVPRHRHHGRDRDRAAPHGRRRSRGDGSRQWTRHRPRRCRDGRRQHGASASPQGTHPTRTGGQSRCRTTTPAS